MDSAGLGELVATYANVQRAGAVLQVTGLTKRFAELDVVSKSRGLFQIEPEQIADPLNPNLRDFGWELRIGVTLAILVILGVLLVLR